MIVIILICIMVQIVWGKIYIVLVDTNLTAKGKMLEAEGELEEELIKTCDEA